MKEKDHKLIKIRNASIHNLKEVDVDIPKNKITVITGPSGSGKSSLAFDTLFVEGQKRFIESLFSSSRHYLEKFGATSVEKITGLTPSISVDQKTKNLGPRSTVGTQTEIYDYLRVLFSKLSSNQTDDLTLTRDTKLITNYLYQSYEKDIVINLIAKVPKRDFESYIQNGFEKIYHDKVVKLVKSEDMENTELQFIINRLKISTESVVQKKIESTLDRFKDDLYIASSATPKKLVKIESNKNSSGFKITPQLFSFNSPYGYCNNCKGLGSVTDIIMENLITQPQNPIINGSIVIINKKNTLIKKMTEIFLNKTLKKNIEEVTINDLSKKELSALFYGSREKINFKFTFDKSKYDFTDNYPGLVSYSLNVYGQSDLKDEFNLITKKKCPQCNGSRLNQKSLSYCINGKNIFDLSSLEITDLISIIKKFKLTPDQNIISKPLITEILKRLNFLEEIGLGYLPLIRVANTLSGGESQRIKIATQLGSSLSGITYILDEPSIGLHPSDNNKLIKMLRSLKELNNTIVIVEHDEDIITNSDYIIDVGPGAGEHGGQIIATGSPREIASNKDSLTGKYLFGDKKLPAKIDDNSSHFILISGINFRNIIDANVKIPLNSITTITGVSGSGKSTLTHDVISNAIKYNVANKNLTHLYNKDYYKKITGHENIKQVINLDQKPIGRSYKSNPSTYLGFFTIIRELFASTPEAKLKGMKAKHFSFNLKDGRCSECEGNGVIKVEMQFLQDVKLKCKSCNGKRYSNKILNIKFKNHDIAQILNLTVNEAQKVFSNHTKINHFLTTLIEIGLGYIKLGQSSTTVSGGEAQRLKIAKELVKKVKGHTLYVLDEPSTGLHFSDVELLKNCIQKLKENGHTVIIIEHNSDIISKSDYIVEMGPGGGKHGGKIIYQGHINNIKQSKKSITKKYL
jgi:excinuclease ABC subunit A